MKRLLVTIVLLLPSVAFGAGFAKDPLFLSRTPVTEGQSVHIYAVIENPDTSAFSGTLVFYDNNTKIGTNAITLAAGATQTASIVWAPTAGTHPVSAQLVAGDGSIAEAVNQTFVVDPKPQAAGTDTTTQSSAVIDSSAGIQKDIAGVSPQVAGATQPLFSVLDSARNAAADALDSQINATQQKIKTAPKPGIVEGASTQDPQIQNPTTGFWYWLYTIYLYALEGLRWLVGNAGVFYPVLAILFLYVLYKMYRRFRRPAWQR